MRMEDRNSHLSPADRSAALPAPEDFLTEADAAAAAAGGAASAAGVFADLVGCKSVLEKLKEWQATITASQKLGVDPLESFELNFLFVGSPGAACSQQGGRHSPCVACLPCLCSGLSIAGAVLNTVYYSDRMHVCQQLLLRQRIVLEISQKQRSTELWCAQALARPPLPAVLASCSSSLASWPQMRWWSAQQETS